MQDEIFYPDFFITPRVIWMDPNLSPMAEKVYAVVYWYSKLKDGYCHASNATIAKNIGEVHPRSVSRSIDQLIQGGYMHAEYDENGNRTALLPLIEYTVNPTPNGEGGVHQMVNHNKNNKKESKTIKKFSNEIDRLYKGWLIEMVIGSRKWLGASESERSQLLESAAKRCTLTLKRKQKLAARLDSLEFSVCAKAIKKIGESDFHKGQNDRKWKATLEWLFNTDEKVEEFANR